MILYLLKDYKVSSTVSSFIPGLSKFSLLPMSWSGQRKVCQFCWFFSKQQLVASFIFLIPFLVSLKFISDLYYFLPSICFLFFFWLLNMEVYVTDLRSSFSSSIIYIYIFFLRESERAELLEEDRRGTREPSFFFLNKDIYSFQCPS